MSGQLVGPGSSTANVICEVCSATFHTAAVSSLATSPCGRCENCGGPLWPLIAGTEPAPPRPPAGVYDLDAFRRSRR